MLVLTRRKDETILIPGIGEIKVVDVRGKTVRIGLEFPPEIPIQRGELAPLDDGPEQQQDGNADTASPVAI